MAWALEDGSCKVCGIEPLPGLRLWRCSICRLMVYCSRPCQRIDWKEHKPLCDRATKKFKDSKPAGAGARSPGAGTETGTESEPAAKGAGPAPEPGEVEGAGARAGTGAATCPKCRFCKGRATFCRGCMSADEFRAAFNKSFTQTAENDPK